MHNPMARRRRVPMTTVPPDDRLFEVERKQRELRADVEQLRRELAGEVVTRRLVVEGPDGRTVVEGGHVVVEETAAGSSIDLHAASDGAELRVYSGPAEVLTWGHPDSVAVSVFAGTATSGGGEGSRANVTVYVGGDDESRHVVSDDPSELPLLLQRVGWLEEQEGRQATVIHGAGAVLASLFEHPDDESGVRRGQLIVDDAASADPDVEERLAKLDEQVALVERRHAEIVELVARDVPLFERLVGEAGRLQRKLKDARTALQVVAAAAKTGGDAFEAAEVES